MSQGIPEINSPGETIVPKDTKCCPMPSSNFISFCLKEKCEWWLPTKSIDTTTDPRPAGCAIKRLAMEA